MRRIPAYLVLLIVALAVGAPDTVVAAPGGTDAAVSWLRSQQQADGGFLGFSGGSDPGSTADVALAFAAAGVSPSSVSAGGPSIVDYLRSSAASYGGSTGGAAKLTLAAVASGADPTAFGGVDLVGRLRTSVNPQTGLMDQQLFVHALGMLALEAAGQTVPAAAITALTDHQIRDGSWAFTGSTDAGQGDTNTTAIAIQALVAAGKAGSSAVTDGLAYLASAGAPDGSVTYQPGKENPPVGDTNSTAVALQALAAAGQMGGSRYRQMENALDTYQNPTGAFYFRADAKDDNLLATAQAVPALRGVWLGALGAGSGKPGSILPATGQRRGDPVIRMALLAGGLATVAAGSQLRRRMSARR
jgi:hypothetical protein